MASNAIDELTQLLPQNIEAEQAVLGAILLDDNALPTALEYLTANDFYRKSHKQIFIAMRTVADKCQGVDIITLCEYLDCHNQLEAIGGQSYIAELAINQPTAANVKYHCEIIREKAKRREVIQGCQTAMSKAQAGDDLNEVMAAIPANRIADDPETKHKLISLVKIGNIFSKGIDPVSPIVEDFIMEGGIHMFSLPSGQFKTFLLNYHLADCVSRGVPFLGLRTSKQNVISIDKENNEPVIYRYGELLGIDKDSDVNLWPLSAERGAPTFPNDAYIEIARQYAPCLIIFDSLIRFYPDGMDENISTHIAPIITFLKRLTQAGATVVVLHHAGKADNSEYRGSSDLKGGVDVLWTGRRTDTDNGTELKLKCLKSRFYAEREINLQVVSFDDSIKFELAQDRRDADLEIIAGLLNEPMTYSALFEAVRHRFEGMGKSRFARLMDAGLGRFWTRKRSGRNTIFSPIDPVWSVSPPYKAADYQTKTPNQTKTNRTKENGKTPQVIDSIAQSDSPADHRTNQTNETIDIAEVTNGI